MISFRYTLGIITVGVVSLILLSQYLLADSSTPSESLPSHQYTFHEYQLLAYTDSDNFPASESNQSFLIKDRVIKSTVIQIPSINWTGMEILSSNIINYSNGRDITLDFCDIILDVRDNTELVNLTLVWFDSLAAKQYPVVFLQNKMDIFKPGSNIEYQLDVNKYSYNSSFNYYYGTSIFNMDDINDYIYLDETVYCRIFFLSYIHTYNTLINPIITWTAILEDNEVQLTINSINLQAIPKLATQSSSELNLLLWNESSISLGDPWLIQQSVETIKLRKQNGSSYFLDNVDVDALSVEVGDTIIISLPNGSISNVQSLEEIYNDRSLDDLISHDSYYRIRIDFNHLMTLYQSYGCYVYIQ